MTYEIVTRSQRAPGGSSRFPGPDHYMAVLAIPDGATPPANLRADSLEKRGITLYRIGQYYGRSTGPRSNYAAAMRAAQDLIERLRAQ